jgi:superfamily II DNA or RNA helicase
MKKVTLADGREVIVVQQLPSLSGTQNYLIIEDNKGNRFITTRQEFDVLLPNRQLSGSEKLSLFMSYFSGRPDVVAEWYPSKNSPKGGYGPACQRKFNREEGCLLGQGGRCSTCPVSNFYPYSTEMVKQHISGGQQPFYGIYPMQLDDTTYLLVMDFDNEHAEVQAKIVVETIQQLGLDVLIERSRSGKGIHLWFFFEQKISARLARQFGMAILNQAIMGSKALDFSSFDRMIPMQDTLPSGGWGNLIALPLKFENVARGKSTFLNRQFESISKERLWEHLLSRKKYSLDEVAAFVEKFGFETNTLLYEKTRIKDKKIRKNVNLLPQAIKCQISGELKIPIENLTRQEIVQLMYLATFKNPEYYKKQRMRVFIDEKTPRLYSIAREDDEYVYLPRGLRKQLSEMIPEVTCQEKRSDGIPIEVKFKGELRVEQQLALTALEGLDMGVISARTGFGKTVLGAKLITDKKCSTVVLVHTQTLVEQWKERLNQFLSIETEPYVEYTPTGRVRKKDKIGVLAGANDKQSRVVDIVSISKLSRLSSAELDKFFSLYGMVIVDECHHIAAQTFDKVIRHATCRYVYGLSATPTREDGLEPIIFMRCGEVVFQSQLGSSENALIQQFYYPRFTQFAEIDEEFSHLPYTQLVQKLSQSQARNNRIVEDLVEQYGAGRKILVLSERVAHLQELQEMLKNELVDVVSFSLASQSSRKERSEIISELRHFDKPFVLFATGKLVGEGFDLPQLDTLFFGLPFSAKNNQTQYLGRLQRNLDRKDELRVFDYVDLWIRQFAAMFMKRTKTYKKLDYQLAQDERTAPEQEKLFDGKSYLQRLTQDIDNARSSIYIKVPRLNQAMVSYLQRLDGIDSRIETTSSDHLGGKFSQVQEQLLLQLKELGVMVNVHPKVHDQLVVIDQQISWFGTVNYFGYPNTDATTLRIVSEEWAKHFLQR